MMLLWSYQKGEGYLTMSDRNFMTLIVLIIVGVIGAVLVFGGESSNNGTFFGEPLEVARGQADADGNVQRADHVKGGSDAKVTLIEYGDFECPACFAFFPELQQLEAAYPDDLEVVFRHNPLSSIHPNAFAAHRASVAADNQGMFWEMHDILYERQPAWSATQSGLDITGAATVFESYAEELGLDIEQFNADVASQATFDFIDSHLDSGSQLGVTGTPTIFINGEEVNERSFAELSAIVDSILAEENETEETPDNTEATEETSGDQAELETTE